MQAKREDDDIIVTLSPTEAHVLIWGGRADAAQAIKSDFRHTLVNVEDGEFTDEEYAALFSDLDAIYQEIVDRPRILAAT